MRFFLVSNRIYIGTTFRIHKPIHAYKIDKPHGGLRYRVLTLMSKSVHVSYDDINIPSFYHVHTGTKTNTIWVDGVRTKLKSVDE